MTRAAALAALLVLAGCNKAPDAAATASAREIDAGMRKAVDDTDAARREATIPARPVVTREPTSR